MSSNSHNHHEIDQNLLREWRASLDRELGQGQTTTFLLREGRGIIQRAWRWFRDLCAMPRHLRRRWLRRLGMSLAGAALFLALNSAPLLADTVDVSTTNDHLDALCSTINTTNVKQSPIVDNGISLREAVCATNYTIGDDTINLPAGTFTLTLTGAGENWNEAGDLDIFNAQNDDSSLTLIGAGATDSIINGNQADRIFDNSGAVGLWNELEFELRGVTLEDGNTTGGGGAIYVYEPGVLTVDHCIIQNNSADQYGGARF